MTLLIPELRNFCHKWIKTMHYNIINQKTTLSTRLIFHSYMKESIKQKK